MPTEMDHERIKLAINEVVWSTAPEDWTLADAESVAVACFQRFLAREEIVARRRATPGPLPVADETLERRP